MAEDRELLATNPAAMSKTPPGLRVRPSAWISVNRINTAELMSLHVVGVTSSWIPFSPCRTIHIGAFHICLPNHCQTNC